MPKYKDYPIDECARVAAQYIKEGARVYQKWTCDGCGDRVTANQPNHWTELGHHEDCGHITNIKAKGCNYMLVWSKPGKELK
jgi:hypothetical protein